MNPNRRWRRSLRLKIAPAGSPQDRWLRDGIRSWSKLRQTRWQSLALRILPQFIAYPIKDAVRQRKIEASVPYQKQFQAILEIHRDAKQVILFPPSLDWDVQLFQRPQQLALALAEQGALVFYMHPSAVAGTTAFEQYQARIYLCNVPIETFAILDSPLIYLLTWNRTYASAFRTPRIIYDYVDDIKVFDGNYKQMVFDHEQLVRGSHLVLTTAAALYSATKKMRPDALLCPNGVNYAHFQVAKDKKNLDPPDDMISIINRGNPIVGYYGALAEWFDYDLVMALARQRSDISFVIIGPDYDGTMHPDFLDFPNLDWLNVKPYKQLPIYLAYFDVAIIPFVLNEITHAVSPLKLFEYMAGGKPVIVTPMKESMRYEDVIVADNVNTFSECIDQALDLGGDETYLHRIEKTALESTWQARAKQILSALEQIG